MYLQILSGLGGLWLVASGVLFALEMPFQFQRAGSVGVCIGILLLSYFNREIAVAQTEFARSKNDKAYTAGVRFTYNALMAYEVVFVVLGTLQWGYGDLLVCWFHGMACA